MGGGGISNFLERDKGGLLKFLRDERRVAIFFLHIFSKEALFCGCFLERKPSLKKVC